MPLALGPAGLVQQSIALKSTRVEESLRAAQSKMQHVTASRPQDQAWEHLWRENVTPWEAKKPAPPLVNLLDTTTHVPDTARVLVPGCGSAYDVIAFTGKQRFVVGLDISETAVQLARRNLEAHGVSPDKAVIKVGDFFTFDEGPFDTIYDYTFLASLPPAMRHGWASGIDRLLARDGKLITLIFPLGNFEGGPPFAMSFELIKGLLDSLGLEAIESSQPKVSHAARQGREWLAVWQRKE